MAVAYGTGVPGVWFRHDAAFAHDIPGHPERPERLRVLEARMNANGWFGAERREAPAATRVQLRQCHPEHHIALIEDLCAAGGGQIDMDTAAIGPTWEAALRAAGGAAALVDALLAREAPFGVAALRPPGHHAEARRAMGFCFFNNVAVAARQATIEHGLERVLIFDWDVHHGNGTQDIFWARPDVLFVSAHQWPLYPGSGAAGEVGVAAGEGYTVNLPVPPGTGDAAYASLVEHVVRPLVLTWEPQLVLLSAGFDAHRLDPLADCQVTETGFAVMTAILRRACETVRAPLGIVLEGGYSTEALANSFAELMRVLSADVAPAAPAVALHPLAAAAAARMGRWWPSVAAEASSL
jgi:acetoin utilization deacetylase AcuC-like enzyme